MYKESKDQHGNKFSVSVLTPNGNEIKLDVNPDMKIEQLKDQSIKKLDLSGMDSNNFHVIKILNGCRKISLNSNTLKAEGISAHDALLLYPLRKETLSSSQSSNTEVPNTAAINKATTHLPLNVTSKRVKENVTTPPSTTAPLEQTFRKILLTLLDLSYQLMFFDEEAEEIFKNKYEVTVHPDLIKQLTPMGFTEKHAKEALIINDMNVESSMEWCLKHSETMTEEDDEEVSESSSSQDRSVNDISKRLSRWKKRTNSPKSNSLHVTSLMDMGFSKEECIEALKYNGNNIMSACNWLLGERTVPDEDPNDTLEPDSDLYKAIVNNPTIHVGLHNKRVLEGRTHLYCLK